MSTQKFIDEVKPKMRAPKEPKTWKRPRLYFQEANDNDESRIRIIYPDGKSEWMVGSDQWENGANATCWSSKIVRLIGPEFENQMCEGCYGKDSSPQQALARMCAYDAEMGFEPAIFCGEL